MSDRPKLGLTTARQAVISVLAGAVVCWLLLLVFEAVGSYPPVVPWSVPITLGVLAILVIIYSRLLPKRREQHRASPQESFAALGVGKAMAMTGAVLAGGHAVYVMRYLQLVDAPLPSQRVVQGSVTLVVALLLAAAGILLERACVIKDKDDDDQHDHPGTAEPA